MWSAVFTAIAGLVKWWTDRQAAQAQKAHDDALMSYQSKADALQGEDNALKQVDKVGAALDGGGVRPIADDPNNDNR